MKNFKTIKNKIIKSAKLSNACETELNRAINSKNIEELLKVVTDNFNYSCNNEILTKELIEEIGIEICNENNIYLNISTGKGFLFADSATVEASGSATVEASGSATVEASGSATVEASGSATVRASGSATVEASGSATVRAWDSATVEASGSTYIDSRNTIDHKISDKVILRYYYENRILFGNEIKL